MEGMAEAVGEAVEKLKAGKRIGTINGEFARELAKALDAEGVSHAAATVWTDGRATCWFTPTEV